MQTTMQTTMPTADAHQPDLEGALSGSCDATPVVIAVGAHDKKTTTTETRQVTIEKNAPKEAVQKMLKPAFTSSKIVLLVLSLLTMAALGVATAALAVALQQSVSSANIAQTAAAMLEDRAMTESATGHAARLQHIKDSQGINGTYVAAEATITMCGGWIEYMMGCQPIEGRGNHCVYRNGECQIGRKDASGTKALCGRSEDCVRVQGRGHGVCIDGLCHAGNVGDKCGTWGHWLTGNGGQSNQEDCMSHLKCTWQTGTCDKK